MAPEAGDRVAIERSLAGLRAEHQQLRSQLDTLRRLEAASAPVVYVTGNDSEDYVVTLPAVLDAPASQQGVSTR